MQTRNNLFMVSSPLLRQVIIESCMMSVASDELASRLTALAEQLYVSRAIEPLAEAAELLMSLPDEKAQAAGRFYIATLAARHGDTTKAASMLESVASIESAPRYRARALQSLGLIYRREGDDGKAARLYKKAAVLATCQPSQDLVTIIRAGINLADIAGSAGDHPRALEHLKAICPAVELAARVAPVYVPMWCNEVALDLAGLGRLNEARRYAQFAINSPFARAYPEWAETVQEIEQQADAKVALNVQPAIQQARKTSIKPKLRLIKKPCPVALFVSTRRRTGPVTTIRPEQPRSRPILEQICLKIRIRAPSF